MRTFIYCRISADREGSGLGVDRQRKDCETLAATLGWTVTDTFIDNDLSAYSGKPRPAYLAMLEAIDNGQGDAIIAWHTDRLHRSPAELETFITLCDRHSTVVRTVQAGELDLSTPSGQMTARIVGAVARHEIDHARKRMIAAHAQAAENGRAHGKIPFGYQAIRDDSGAVTSRMLHPTESPLVREATKRILAGEGTRTVTNDWTERGLLTRAGGKWNPRTLREMLMRPTLAGLRTHRGTTTRGSWEPIITEDEHARLVALFSDPSRRTNAGTKPKHLLSGIALCANCGAVMQWLSARGYPNYACTGCTRVARSVAFVDGLIEKGLIAWLTQSDASRILEPEPIITPGDRDELEALEARLATAADMLADGDIDRAGYIRIKTRVTPRITELKALIQPNVTKQDFLKRLAKDPVTVWAGATLTQKRDTIRKVFDGIIILKAYGKRHDPASVIHIWATDLS